MPDKNTYIDQTAIVHPSAQIGSGSSIWNWTKVRENAEIGTVCNIGQNCYIDESVIIGDGCKIQNGVSVYKGVTLGSQVFVGPNVTFTNDYIPRADNPDWEIIDTRVENGVSIGANATIICGVTLGERSMVAAGAVVTRDVMPFTLVMGVPAKPVDQIDINGNRLCVDQQELVLD